MPSCASDGQQTTSARPENQRRRGDRERKDRQEPASTSTREARRRQRKAQGLLHTPIDVPYELRLGLSDVGLLAAGTEDDRASVAAAALEAVARFLETAGAEDIRPRISHEVLCELADTSLLSDADCDSDAALEAAINSILMEVARAMRSPTRGRGANLIELLSPPSEDQRR